MHILIDAYNLIKKVYTNRFASKDHVKSCLAILMRYAILKNHHLTVVFDGGISAWQTDQYYSPRCRVWWAGHEAKADDLIKEFLGEGSLWHLLVSCDRELVLYAQENKIPSIEAAFFWQFVQKAVKESGQQSSKLEHNQSQSSSNNQSLNEIMEEFSLQIETKEADTEKNAIFLQKKHLSKIEIQLYTIIKKL